MLRCLACLIVLVLPRLAAADTRAEAEAQFEQGIRDMKAGDFAKACPELAESNAKLPDSGTQGSLALCYTSLGKVASAWLLWRQLAETAPEKLRADAANKAEKLAPRVPHVVVKLAGDTPGLAVTLDGKPVEPKAAPLPIDPGTVWVRASADGREPFATEVTLAEGQTVTVDIPVLATRPVAIEPHPAPPAEDRGAARHRRHLLALGVGVLGGATLVGGLSFGLKARSDWNDAKATCGGMIDSCPVDKVAQSQHQVDDARNAALASTIMFGVGAAAIAASAYLWVTAPEENSVAIVPMAGGYGLAASGTF